MQWWNERVSRILRAFLENEEAIRRLILRSLPKGAIAEDLTQETFLRAFAAEATEVILSPKAYLFQTAKNLALNERAKSHQKLTDHIEDLPDPTVLLDEGAAPQDEAIDSRRKLRLFAEAVSTLPLQCRRVFLMRKIHGLSHAEIAAELGISVSTVEKHVAAGLLKCAQHLRSRGYDVS